MNEHHIPGRPIDALRAFIGEERTTNLDRRLADAARQLADGGGTVTYAYDAANNACWAYVGSSGNACGTPPSGATSFSYDADNNRTDTNYPGSIDMSQRWDNGDRLLEGKALKSGASTPLTDFTYAYNDSAGTDRDRRASVLDGVSNNLTTFSYEAQHGWLTEALTKGSGGSGSTVADYKYEYDGNGNLFHRSDSTGASWTTFGYNTDNELCWSVGGKLTTTGCGTTPTGATTYSYDADGQETSQSGRGTLAWNKRHQATSVFATTMGYFGPDNNLRLSDGSTTFKYNSLGLGTKTASGASIYYTRDPSGQLLNERTSGGTYNYLVDGLGSVVALTDSTGAVQRTYKYDPYGASTGGTGTIDNPWQYAAGYNDSGPGVQKFGARYYDPSITRWNQPDPIDATSVQQGNRYLYVMGNPPNGTDPGGKSFLGDALEVGGEVVAAGGLVAAPFTGGATLPLAFAGAGVSFTGLGINAVHDDPYRRGAPRTYRDYPRLHSLQYLEDEPAGY